MANNPTDGGQTGQTNDTSSGSGSGSADSGGGGNHQGHKSGNGGAFTVQDWAHAVLNGLGIKPTKQNTHWMVAWAAAEGGHWNNTAHFNPINTTLDMPGATSMNSVGVKAYTSWQEGVKAAVRTLQQSNMSGIVSALHGSSGSGFASAVVNSPWGTKQLNIGGNYSSYGKTAGSQGGTYTGGSGGNAGTQSVGPKDVREGLNSMGFASQLIHSNKSLQKAFESIIHDQLDLSSSAGQTRATQILQNTAWFQNHDKAQRQFEELKFSDPSQFDAMIKQERDSLKSEAEGLGLSLDPNDLDHMSRMVARNGLTSDEVNQVMARHVNLEKGQAYTGTIGSTLDALRQGAASYYVPINEQQLQHYTRQVIAGNLDPSSLNDVFKQQALSMYPYLKTQLNEGHTVADIANPYQQMISQTLELDPNGIKHNDPLVMQALQSKDAQGNMGLMPLWQFQQKLYDDPRWLNTQNAHQSLVSTTGSILQKMGLIS